ncbi:MAG TPA: hypothetical protein VLJ15_08710, partial [Gammaproteobacteria bacterium]|nr:hypothetical protein [Gammaproteobacteria bacterium]
MKFSFPVIVKKTAATDRGDAILIPRLGITKTLSEAEKSQIENTGLKPYLESLLLSILAEKRRKNEYIELPKMMDGLIDKFLNKNSKIELYPHDLILTVEVEFEMSRRRRFFSTCLPPLMKLTILIEISAGMILSIGTLELTENSFIPMSAEASQAVTITQSALSTALNLWIALSGPGMAFIENFGVALDDRLNRTCLKKPVTSPETEDMPGEEKPSGSTQTKIRLVQGVFLLLVVNSLWTGVTMDYQQMTLLTTQLEDATNSLFPDWLISAAAYT